jgi:hypothetical protein
VEEKPPGWVENTEIVGEMVKEATSELYDGVATAVKDIANALKVPAAHVYSVLVKQQAVQSITYLLILLFVLVLSLSLGLSGLFSENVNVTIYDTYCSDQKRVKKELIGKSDTNIAKMIIGGVLMLGFIIGLLACGKTIVTGFVNPEYGAMMEIMNFVK